MKLLLCIAIVCIYINCPTKHRIDLFSGCFTRQCPGHQQHPRVPGIISVFSQCDCERSSSIERRSLSAIAFFVIQTIFLTALRTGTAQAHSRAGGYHYLGSTSGKAFNTPVFVQAKVIKNVMASAAEAEVAALYLNAQEAPPIRQCLVEMGHPQLATKMNTDNQTATGIVNGTIKQRRSKAIDMQFY